MNYLKPRYIIYLALLALGAWTIYLGREVLTPFIFAALFAYLLDPVVSGLSSRGVPRGLSIVIVYIGIVVLMIGTGYFLGDKLVSETKQFASEAKTILEQVENGKSGLPSWADPYMVDLSRSLRNSINFSAEQVVNLFSGAINSLISFFVFLFILFYFLKDGQSFFRSTEHLLPGKAKIEFAIASGKVNQVIGNYLRSQVFMVIWMMVVVTILLTILGVRFSLILGIVTGLAELLPFIGPTFAFVVILLVTSLTGGAGLLQTLPMYEGIIAAVIYIVINQLQNVFVAPQITARLVRLHPLLVLGAVLVGGHLFGLVGILFAVPIVASFKVVLEHILDLLE